MLTLCTGSGVEKLSWCWDSAELRVTAPAGSGDVGVALPRETLRPLRSGGRCMELPRRELLASVCCIDGAQPQARRKEDSHNGTGRVAWGLTHHKKGLAISWM